MTGHMTSPPGARPAPNPALAPAPALAPWLVTFFSPRPLPPPMPAVGTPAPPLALRDQAGRIVRLADLRGRIVVVTFYAEDFTPVCDVQVCGLNAVAGEFEKRGAAILAVSPDSVESHAEYAKEKRIAFPLLSDPDKSAMVRWDSWGRKLMYGREVEGILRNTFLVGPDGRIARAFLKIRTPGHAQRVLDAVDALRAGASVAKPERDARRKARR